MEVEVADTDSGGDASASDSSEPVDVPADLDTVDGGPSDSDTTHSSAIQPALNASRVQGVAPLAVVVDALGTAHGDADTHLTFDLRYEWDFGETGVDSWPVTNMSKGRGLGRVAAHVYSSPGTYTITLTVSDPSGDTAVDTVEVQVHEPASVYGTTICLSSSGDFEGCPAQAQQLTSIDIHSALEAIASAQGAVRLLLRRGDTFTSAQPAVITHMGPGHVGAFGSGAKPVVSVDDGAFVVVDGLLEDWRFVGFEVRGSDDLDGNSFLEASESSDPLTSVNDLLLHRLTLRDMTRTLLLLGGPPPVHSNVVVSETSSLSRAAGNNDLVLAVDGLALLGVETADAGPAGRSVRGVHLSRYVVSQSSFDERDGSAFIIGGSGGAAACGGSGVVSDNFFSTAAEVNANHFAAVGGGDGDCIEDVVIERNLFRFEPGNAFGSMLGIGGSGFLVRNNIFDITAGQTGVRFAPWSSDQEQAVSHNAAHNNTCVSTREDLRAYCVEVKLSVEQTTATNNLLYAPNAAGLEAYGVLERAAGAIANSCSSEFPECNSLVITSPFVSTGLTAAADFALAPAGLDGDLGQPTSSVRADFGDHCRPSGGWDIGAWQRGGLPCP